MVWAGIMLKRVSGYKKTSLGKIRKDIAMVYYYNAVGNSTKKPKICAISLRSFLYQNI